MPRPKLDEFKSYLVRLCANFLSERNAAYLASDPADPVVLDGPWPYTFGDPVTEFVMSELGEPEKSKEEIVARLKSFYYPYPEGNKSGKTFYEHLKSLGLLNSLLATPLLWDIRMVWTFQKTYKLELSLKREKLSQHNLPLAFHREILHLLFDHIERIACVAEKYDVPDQVWFHDYYKAIQKQLLRDGASYYPRLNENFKPAHKSRVWSHEVNNQVDLYFKLLKSFAECGQKSKKLARQVAAVLCSGPECIPNKKLDPNPERIRKYVRDSQTRHRKQKARCTKASIKPAKKS